MASKKSAKYPYQWPDGSWHSITWAQHQQNTSGGGGVFINGKPVTQEQWQSGALLAEMVQPPPGALPQPHDPAFAQQQQQATWNRGLADNEATYQSGETAWGLGYNADGSLNTANPYSQAQLLQNEYKRSVTGTNTSMFAAGQGYSGARLNAQGRNDRVYAEGSSALRDRARQTYHGINYGRLTSYGQNSLGLTGDDWAAVSRSVYGS